MMCITMHDHELGACVCMDGCSYVYDGMYAYVLSLCSYILVSHVQLTCIIASCVCFACVHSMVVMINLHTDTSMCMRV